MRPQEWEDQTNFTPKIYDVSDCNKIRNEIINKGNDWTLYTLTFLLMLVVAIYLNREVAFMSPKLATTVTLALLSAFFAKTLYKKFITIVCNKYLNSTTDNFHQATVKMLVLEKIRKESVMEYILTSRVLWCILMLSSCLISMAWAYEPQFNVAQFARGMVACTLLMSFIHSVVTVVSACSIDSE